MKYKVGKKYKLISDKIPSGIRAYFEENNITDNTIIAETVVGVGGDSNALCAKINGHLCHMLFGDRLGNTVFQVPNKFKVGKKYKVTDAARFSSRSNIKKHWKFCGIADNTVKVAYVDSDGDAYAHTNYNQLMCVLTLQDIQTYGVVIA